MFRLKGRWGGGGGGGGGDGALIGGKALHRGALSSAIEQELKKGFEAYIWALIRGDAVIIISYKKSK